MYTFSGMWLLWLLDTLCDASALWNISRENRVIEQVDTPGFMFMYDRVGMIF